MSPGSEKLTRARERLRATALEVTNAAKTLAIVTDDAHANYRRLLAEYRSAQHHIETLLKDRGQRLQTAGRELLTVRGLVDAARMIEADPWGAFAGVDERFGSGVALALLVSHRYEFRRRAMPAMTSREAILRLIEDEIAEKLGVIA